MKKLNFIALYILSACFFGASLGAATPDSVENNFITFTVESDDTTISMYCPDAGPIMLLKQNEQFKSLKIDRQEGTITILHGVSERTLTRQIYKAKKTIIPLSAGCSMSFDGEISKY